MIITIPMKINAEKKHSVRYDAIGTDAAIQSAYINRKHLPVKIPENVTIKLEVGE